jgi:hypothetical protein
LGYKKETVADATEQLDTTVEPMISTRTQRKVMFFICLRKKGEKEGTPNGILAMLMFILETTIHNIKQQDIPGGI